MTTAEAAEGRRLLHLVARDLPLRESIRLKREFSDWLWSNREELVRCAELVAGRTLGDGASER